MQILHRCCLANSRFLKLKSNYFKVCSVQVWAPYALLLLPGVRKYSHISRGAECCHLLHLLSAAKDLGRQRSCNWSCTECCMAQRLEGRLCARVGGSTAVRRVSVSGLLSAGGAGWSWCQFELTIHVSIRSVKDVNAVKRTKLSDPQYVLILRHFCHEI